MNSTPKNAYQELKFRRDKAHAAFKANETETVNAVVDFLQEHCVPAGFEIKATLRFDCYADFYRDGLRGDIAFKLPKTDKDGFDTDFGSDFHITILSDKIKINKGCIGDYDLSNGYQVARDRLLAAIWDNHDAITSIFKEHFDKSLYVEFDKWNNELRRVDDEIAENERKRKLQETLEHLKQSKFIADCYKYNRYNPEYSKVIGYEHEVRDILVIDKITDKSVFCKPLNSWNSTQKRLNLEQVLVNVQHGCMVASIEEPKNWFEPIE